MINSHVRSAAPVTLRVGEVGIENTDWSPTVTSAETAIPEKSQPPMMTLLFRLRKRIFYLFGWLDCPRCSELVRPRYISDTLRHFLTRFQFHNPNYFTHQLRRSISSPITLRRRYGSNYGAQKIIDYL